MSSHLNNDVQVSDCLKRNPLDKTEIKNKRFKLEIRHFTYLQSPKWLHTRAEMLRQ